MSTRPSVGSERRLLGASIAIGIGALTAVIVAGVTFAVTRPERLTARASMVVLPDDTISDEDMAGYYETLNQGQVVATFAEILRSRFGVADVEGLTAAQREGVSSDVEVVPDTAVIEVAVVASDEADAVSIANAIAEEASAYVADLTNPYQLVLLDEAEKAESEEVAIGALIVVVVLVAIVSALAVQQLVFQLGTLLSRRRQLRATSA